MEQNPLTPRSHKFHAVFTQTATDIDKILDVSKVTLNNLANDQNNQDHHDVLAQHAIALNAKADHIEVILGQDKSDDHAQQRIF